MSNTRQVLIFILLVWFFNTFSLFISNYTTPIITALLKELSTYAFLPKGLFGIFSVVLANIDQFLTFCVCGVFLRAIIIDIGKSRMLAILLFCIFTSISLISVLLNFQSIYGNKISFVLAKIIVVIINFISILFGLAIVGRFQKEDHE